VLRVASIPAFVLKKVSKPSFTVTETEHKYLNHTYWYPGRVEWEPITLSIVDPVNPDAAKIMVELLKKSGYHPQDAGGASGTAHATISKKKAVDALGNLVKIEQISADGGVVETWELQNPFVTDVKFGDLDYETDDMSEIELTIRYDWAILTSADDSKFFD
jgi:hypothetical protein